MVISSVCLIGFLSLFMLGNGLTFLFAATLSLITLVPMIAGVLALDRVEPEPKSLLLTTFLWGAGVAIALSLIFEELGFVLLAPSFGGSEDFLLAVILAPIVEEIMKALVLFGLLFFRRREINGITDGIVYAAVSALGFAAAENIEYYIFAAGDGAGSMIALFVVRGVISPFCHPVFTSMTGVAIALSIGKRGPSSFLLPLGGLLAAIFLHALWNGSTLFGLGGLGLAFLVTVGVLIGLLVAIRKDRIKCVERIVVCLAQYQPTGLVTPGDLTMLSSLPLRKQARVWAKEMRGKPGMEAMRDYQQACTELSMLHDSAYLGLVSTLEFEKDRLDLLTVMEMTREGFLGPKHLAVEIAPPITQGFIQDPPPRQIEYVDPEPTYTPPLPPTWNTIPFPGSQADSQWGSPTPPPSQAFGVTPPEPESNPSGPSPILTVRAWSATADPPAP